MALVSKILEATLAAGSTAVTFTDSDIPNSLIRVFSSDSTVIPESRMLSGNTLTVVYPAQTSTLYVALEIVKQGLDIVDDLTSSDTDKALSAKQGKVLNSDIETLTENVGTLSENLGTLTETVNNLDIPDSITDLDDINITSIQNGQVLAWDDTSQKFVNVNQSGGSSETYTTAGTVIGTWIDNSDIILKVYPVNTSKTYNFNTWNSTGITDSNIKIILDAFITEYATGTGASTFTPVVAQYYNNDLNIWLTRERNTSYTDNHYIVLKYVKA